MTEPQPEPQPQPTEPTEPTPTEPTPTEPTPGTETNPPTEGEPEGEPAEAQPPEGEPPPAEPLAAVKSEGEWEEIGKKLERSATTWRNRVSELLGESASDLVICELCDPTLPGFHFPAVVTQPRNPIHERLLAVLLTPQTIELKQDPNTRTCPTCEGEGELLTGSKVTNNAKHKCGDCEGYGFVPPPSKSADGRPQADLRLAPVGEAPEPHEGGDVDPTGEPKLLPDGRENPNWGMWPQFKRPVEPWGDTRGLTPSDAVPSDESATLP